MILKSVITCETPEDTIELGIKIGGQLQPDMVICLNGSLGAGKTTMVKGIARGLCIEDEITSPTFTIVSEYYGKLKLYHMDMYRIEDDDELTFIGFDEMIESGGVSLIEWGDKFAHLLPDHTIYINLEIQNDQKRKIIIEGLKL